MTSTDLRVPGTAEGFAVDPGACEQNEAALDALERSSVSEVLKEQIRTVLETSRPCAVKGAMMRHVLRSPAMPSDFGTKRWVIQILTQQFSDNCPIWVRCPWQRPNIKEPASKMLGFGVFWLLNNYLCQRLGVYIVFMIHHKR